jgi:hypothetical protein
MGLDQYAYRLDRKPEKPVDFDIGEGGSETIYQWRKHPDLQGFMETLYYMKGGKRPEFNCSPVLLEREDLDLLERKTRDRELPKTEGFFFGQSGPEDDEEVYRFIAKARQAIKEGSWIAYDSWW